MEKGFMERVTLKGALDMSTVVLDTKGRVVPDKL